MYHDCIAPRVTTQVPARYNSLQTESVRRQSQEEPGREGGRSGHACWLWVNAVCRVPGQSSPLCFRRVTAERWDSSKNSPSESAWNKPVPLQMATWEATLVLQPIVLFSRKVRKGLLGSCHQPSRRLLLNALSGEKSSSFESLRLFKDRADVWRDTYMGKFSFTRKKNVTRAIGSGFWSYFHNTGS